MVVATIITEHINATSVIISMRGVGRENAKMCSQFDASMARYTN